MVADSTSILSTTVISHNSLSPGQGNTRLQLDVPSAVVNEAATSYYRSTWDMVVLSGEAKDASNSQRIRRWASGAMTLLPVQENINFSYETLPDGFDPSKFVYAPGTDTKYQLLKLYSSYATLLASWKYPTGIGFIQSPSAQASGDPWYKRSVPAGSSWAGADTSMPATMTPPPPQESGQSGLIAGTYMFSPPAVAMNSVYFTETNRPPDQGFFLRWVAPSTKNAAPDYVFGFLFGQYYLSFGGSGEATLSEYCQPHNGGAYRWQKRRTFWYCATGRAMNEPHCMTIFPHRGPEGQKYIAFVPQEVTNANAGDSLFLSAPPARAGNLTEVIYEANSINRYGDIDPSPATIVKSGMIRIDERRDIRLHLNVSDLIFWNRGTIRDAAFAAPDATTLLQSGNPRPFNTRIDANYPVDKFGNRGSIIARVLDADTDSATTVVHPSLALDFYGSGDAPVNGASYTTPVYYGALVSRGANISVSNPGMFEIIPTSVGLTSIAGNDPKAEGGEIAFQDPTGENYAALSAGGDFEAALVMDYQETPNSPVEKVQLARGYCVRPTGTKHGSSEVSFPDEDWNDWRILFTGMSRRTYEVSPRLVDIGNFSIDPTADVDPQTGIQPPWKVTDVIKFRLLTRGFFREQLIIPDLPIRLWSGDKGFVSDAVYEPNTDELDVCIALARNYLGAYIIYDAGAGPLRSFITGNPADTLPMGAWRLLQAQTPADETVFHFWGKPQNTSVANGFILPFGKAAFNEPNSGLIATPLVAKPTAPEWNHLVIRTGFFGATFDFVNERHLYNYWSYQVPGSPIHPGRRFPNGHANPHFIGREKLYLLPDPSLIVPGDQEATDRALVWTGRRLLEFAGCGRKNLSFSAPLYLIRDKNTGRMRPLRFYDKVSVNREEGWFVRDVKIQYNTLNHMASYELEKLYPPTGE